MKIDLTKLKKAKWHILVNAKDSVPIVEDCLCFECQIKKIFNPKKNEG